MRPKHSALQRTLLWIAIIVIVSILLAILAPLAAHAQEGVPMAPAADLDFATTAEEPSTLAAGAAQADCSTSPFGGLLMVGAEREIFVSYRGGSAPYQSWLAAMRLDLTPNGALQPQATWLGGNTDARLANIGEPAAAVADLNADGKFEFLQALRDASGQTILVEQSNTVGTHIWQVNAPNQQGFAVAAGDLTRSGPGEDEVVLASRSPVPSLNVHLVNGINTGALPTDGTTLGIWRSNQGFRDTPELLGVATGDLDGDGFDDEIVVAFREGAGDFVQIIVLEYADGWTQGTGSNLQSNVKELATVRVAASDPLHLEVAAADVDGDSKDEIVLAYDQNSPDNNGYSDKITVRTFDFLITPQTTLITQYGQWENPDVYNPDLAMATGDSDGDGLPEVILAYEDSPYGLTFTALDAEVANIVHRSGWQGIDNFRNMVRSLSVDAADLNRDGVAEIVAGFRDGGNLLQVVRVADTITPTGIITAGMTLVDTWRNGDEGRTGVDDITVRLADWDNDSIKAQYGPALGGVLKCKQVVEPQISSAVFVPPFWKAIQGDQYIYGSVGKTESKEKSNETALSSFYSHSASGYVGVSVGVESDLFSFETSLKATAGYEFNASETRAGSQSTGQSISVGWTNFSNFLVVDDATYDCYSYQLTQNGAPIEGAARFCENKGIKNRSMSLDAWDMREDIDLQYAPVVRDWSSLTLFRSGYASQSSTAPGGEAARAADGNPDGAVANGSVAQTQAGNAPWWQIDLGSMQEITKVRIWNRNNVGCTIGSCMNQLADFYVFVSENDPGTLSNDPAVLKHQPGVISSFHPGPGSRVTTFRLLDGSFNPIRGRYVRIQLAGQGALSLAEVQVFGPNHVEPDRYPVLVTDPDGKTGSDGKYIPGTDGWFHVKLYHPETGQYEFVRTRGNLLWNGSNYGVLKDQQIGDGDSTLTWSLGATTGGASSTITSTSHTAKVGAEFDVEAGIIPVKMQVGGSYEYGTGFETEHTRTVAWEKGFELDGGVQGFPRVVEGQVVQWPAQCRYGVQPYYYELGDESSVGYGHKFLVLDYIVPEHQLKRGPGLGPCRAGTYKTGNNRAPQINSATAPAAASGLTVIEVLNYVQDPDNDALTVISIGGAGHGTATLVGNKIHYTPQPGYVGNDSVSFTVGDGFGGEATGTVKIVVGGAGVQQALFLPAVMR